LTLALSWNKCAKICRRRKQDEAIASYCLILATPLVTTTIRLRFDGRSTAYQRSSRSQCRNRLAAVTLSYLFI